MAEAYFAVAEASLHRAGISDWPSRDGSNRARICPEATAESGDGNARDANVRAGRTP